MNRVQIATCSFLLISLALITILPLLATAKVSHAESLGRWALTTAYPNTFAQCLTSGGYMYCVSGSNVYYSELSSTGVGSWISTTSYPIDAQGVSCVVSGSYIYCVGGYTGGAAPQSADYYAPLSSSGVGPWTNTTAYPIPVWGGSCTATTSDIFCIGGMEAVGTLQSTSVFYAPISSTGIGAWSNGTGYPITISLETCLASNGFIYCLGGRTANGPVPVDSDYYASISSSSGVGEWRQTTNYPQAVQAQSCVIDAWYVYCIGGYVSSASDTDSVYYSLLSSSGGIGPWVNTTSYPVTTEPVCVSSDSYIYCLTGSPYVQPQLSVYYTAVLSSNFTSTVTSSSRQSSTNGTQSTTEETATYSSISLSLSSSFTMATQNSSTMSNSSSAYTSSSMNSSAFSTSPYLERSGQSSMFTNSSNLSIASQYTLTGSKTLSLLNPAAVAGTIAAVMIAVGASIAAVFARRR